MTESGLGVPGVLGEVSRYQPGDFTRFRERSPVPRAISAGRTCGGAARLLAAGSSSWGPGTGLCQVSRRDSRRAGACGRARAARGARGPRRQAAGACGHTRAVRGVLRALEGTETWGVSRA